ncbi:MAG: flagellar assembly protein FliW [Planctomycetes bacterium]|nr:flagellar assembly protein FliW [Planctomycetota bacterium]
MTTTAPLSGPTRSVESTRFGALEVPQERVFRFPDPVLGFPGLHEYAVLENRSGGPFEWLQSCELPSLAFIITNPLLFKPDYRIRVKREELASIGLEKPEEGRVAVILVVPKDPSLMTANLQGPLVFNLQARLAKQLVLVGDEYTTKYRVFRE